MYQPNYYTLSFMMRSARSTRTGEAPIYARITVSGQRAEFNINRNVDPENWNTAKGMSKGRSKRDIELNKYLESIRARISEIHAQLVKDEELINPVVLKNHYLGNIAGPRMLVETFSGVVAQYKEKLEMGDICLCTFLRWERCGKYLSEFLSKREGSPDIPIKKLTSGMIDDFEHFLRVTKENGNNAAVKYIRYLKKVTRIALANKWMDEDPFINKRYTRTQAKREALNEDELKRIMSLNLTDLPSLEKVWDTFIFCCFTGLAFVDVSTLSKAQIDVSVFCPDTVKSYRNIFKLIRQNHLWNKEDDAMFLRRIGAVREDKDTGKFHPTVAGLLMFGYEYEITAVFPNYFLDYQENRTNGIYARWTDRITSQSGDWSGNVFDFILRVIPKLQADLKVPFMFKGNLLDEDTPLHKTVREATVNMLANADFYGRRGVVVQKGADGFRFANPGSMRVSLTEAIQDSASDPRNGVMMKMLAMVKYGERAGSGLQGIFKTWQSVYHCAPKLEVTTSGGVDRTTLTLGFEGHQPDIEAMKLLYDNPDELIEVSDTPESKGESKGEPNYIAKNTGQSKEQSNGEGISVEPNPLHGKGESNRVRVINYLSDDGNLTLPEIAEKLQLSLGGVEKIVRQLKKEGILSREGSTKAGKWIVKLED